MGTKVGSGEYQYELVPSWPKMLKYWSFGPASDAAVNSNDDIYVYSRGEHPVTIWDNDGNLISSWGEGKVSEKGAHGIFITPDDHVWLTDMYYHVVTEHTPGGELLMELGMRNMPSPRWDGRPFNMPTGVASAPNGDIFISDGYGGNRVHRFNRQGDLILSWGTPGLDPGEFALLHNIGIDSKGRVFICDREAYRIQIFDEQGTYLKSWDDVQAPGDIWIQDDIVYVVEQFSVPGLSIWTLAGELITRWRSDEGQGKGTLSSPHGLCVDSQGNIYVTELSTQRVQKFQRV